MSKSNRFQNQAQIERKMKPSKTAILIANIGAALAKPCDGQPDIAVIAAAAAAAAGQIR